jgi:hypothetical protein
MRRTMMIIQHETTKVIEKELDPPPPCAATWNKKKKKVGIEGKETHSAGQEKSKQFVLPLYVDHNKIDGNLDAGKEQIKRKGAQDMISAPSSVSNDNVRSLSGFKSPSKGLKHPRTMFPCLRHLAV